MSGTTEAKLSFAYTCNEGEEGYRLIAHRQNSSKHCRKVLNKAKFTEKLSELKLNWEVQPFKNEPTCQDLH